MQQFVYFEKQGSDRLCGVHCLNSLLQGPYFNEMDLSNIGLELDKQEQEIMFDLDKNSEMYQQYQQQGSNNVAMDGNYSIQVLTQALKNLNNIELQILTVKHYQENDLSNEQGFICNLDKHWFAIRRLNGIFYNLNSTNQYPEIISDFYLGAFLQSVQASGYTIFMVLGQMPTSSKEVIFISQMFGQIQPHQFWYTDQQCQGNLFNLEIQKIRQKDKNFKLNINSTDEKDYEQAIKNSLADMDQDTNQKEEVKPQFQSFTGQGMQISNNNSSNNYDFYEKNIDISDPELNQAIQMSLSDKFSNDVQDGFNLTFRMPDGKSTNQSFQLNATIEVQIKYQDIYDYIKFIQNPEQAFRFILMTGYPRRNLKKMNNTLVQEEFEIRDVVFVVKI